MKIEKLENLLYNTQLEVAKEICEDPITEDYIFIKDKRIELYNLSHFDVLDYEDMIDKYGEDLLLLVFKILKESGVDYFTLGVDL